MSQPQEEVSSDSPAMNRALQLLSDRALDKLPVLLLGESGVGKRRLARWLHQKSLEASSALVVCQLGGEPDEVIDEVLTAKLSQATNGALFVDEIGDLPQSAQMKILTALSQHRLRLIASTREALAALQQKGVLPALLQALGEPIVIPSLRERREDFTALVGSFLVEQGLPEDAIAPAAKEALLQYTWTENVRELKHTIVRVIRANGGAKIKLDHLPPRFHPSEG
jgi:two-component system, NtrC family, response regulator HydG